MKMEDITVEVGNEERKARGSALPGSLRKDSGAHFASLQCAPITRSPREGCSIRLLKKSLPSAKPH